MSEALPAALFKLAQHTQDEARDLREKALHLYNLAGQLKALAIQTAETLNPQHTETSNVQ